MEQFESKNVELIAIANAMLDGQMNLIEGVRKICSLRFTVDDPDNDVFIPIRAIESETDHFPLGEVRSQCASDYLQKIDVEMQSYLSDTRQDILDACKEIIRTFS